MPPSTPSPLPLFPRFVALIPAAGRGVRAGFSRPKQYELIAGRSMIEWTLETFLRCSRIDQVYVALAPDDNGFNLSHPKLSLLRCGGKTRRDSVLNALTHMASQVQPDDWVLVHDAARPGLDLPLLHKLMDELENDSVGGLLAMPMVDTLKRATPEGRVQATLSRQDLWTAQTPQMFRHQLLVRALNAAPEATDEASAVEALGLAPKLVHGHWKNFKVTYGDDVPLMESVMNTLINV